MQRLTIDARNVIDLPVSVALSGAIRGGPFETGIVEIIVAVANGSPR